MDGLLTTHIAGSDCNTTFAGPDQTPKGELVQISWAGALGGGPGSYGGDAGAGPAQGWTSAGGAAAGSAALWDGSLDEMRMGGAWDDGVYPFESELGL